MASSSSRVKVQTRIVLQAAYNGDLRILKKMAKQMDLGVAEDDEGANALHLAAHGGCLECCKFLVEEAWIDVNSTTTKGTTPLVCAVFDGNIEVMKYLLDRGGNPRKKTPGGLTLLHAAAAKGNPADIMLEDHGGTPLHAAASGGHDEAMKILLEHGADAGADVNGSYCGPTSLTQAVKNGFTDIVKFLLEAGADPNDPGEDAVPVGARVTDYKSRAKEAFRKKDYQAALYFFGRVIEINPFDATMFSNRSLCWLRIREGERALSDAQRCRQLMPGWCKGWYLEGTALDFMEDYQGAADAFTEALKLDPESDEIKRALGMANNVVHGYGKASVTTSVPSLQNYEESISGTQHGSVDIEGKATVYAILEPALPDADGSIHWEPPPTGWIKANVDATWDAQTERGGVGVVIRDQTGSVLRSVRSFIPTCVSAESAEIIACVEGLRHLVDFTQWPTILESDAAQVINTLSAGCNDSSANWSLYVEARGLMAGLREVMLSKVNRQGNEVAHCLAQLGKGDLCGVLDDSAPPCVLAMVMEDCNNIMS
ncbi:hypothetical protein QYE76_068211 [Lolium multiflorum]|uniref:RNase H type-1 domain-containing protein n=1 Tax=Lolium multiflorum TaxID=4521 RepID=A0AAD8SDW4_LOLMU|nr:hypothetical protein QYE76_068211 [Lolium multiflorum]